MSDRKVLIIVGDASETLDTLYPYYRLIEGGYRPVVAGPEKRPFQMVMHEVRPGWTITKEWEGYTINADVAFSEIEPEQYVGIFFSGGRAPSTSAKIQTCCGSRGGFGSGAYLAQAFAMGSKFPLEPALSRA